MSTGPGFVYRIHSSQKSCSRRFPRDAHPANLAAAFIALNFSAFAAFGLGPVGDEYWAAAEGGRWRIRESTLLGWALFGGTCGAYAGRALFRHKTRKQPFSSQLHFIAILQAIALAALAGWMLAG